MTNINRLFTQSPRQRDSWQEDQEQIKKELEISSKAVNLFVCLSHFSNPDNRCGEGSSSASEEEHKCPIDHYEHDSFCRSFLKLERQERREFLLKVIEIFPFKMGQQYSSQDSESLNVEFDCLVRSKACLFHKWDKGKIILDFQLKKVKISLNNQEDFIDLKMHIPRRANERPFCIGFEFIGPVKIQNNDEIRIAFGQQDFTKFQKSVIGMSAGVLAEKLSRLVSKKQQILQRKRCKKNIRLWTRPQCIRKIDQMVELGQVRYISSRDLPQTTQSQLQIDKASVVVACSEVQLFKTLSSDPRFTIKVSESDNSLVRGRLLLNEVPRGKSLNHFLIKYKGGHKMVHKLTVLQDHKQTSKQGLVCKTIALYQKLIWNDRIYCQMLMAQHDNYLDDPTPNNSIFNFHNIDSPHNISLIQKMKIVCKEVSNGQFLINIDVKFYRQREFNQETYFSFVQCFKDVFLGLSTMSGLQSDTKIIRNDMLSLFLPERDSFEGLETDSEKEGEEFEVAPNRNETANKHNILLEESQVKDNPYGYLKRHQVEPSPQKEGVIMKDHFLWKNWKRSEDGGLVCRDEELVERQKKMARIVLAKFGETILKGKNIINFSLPVVVFKKQSHLESIARTYLYSPVFTERAAKIEDPLERMKYSIILMMTENALSIHMEKPFNPILGETYQGWIDGCPIYLQQISHHPPVSAYYFIGRGYKKYGSIEPRVSIGLNKGSGYSPNPHYTEFSDGMKIQYICAKIVIGGLLIGDRTFKFQDKIYAFDRKHRFFASMKFGPKEQGFFSSSPEPQDYFSGNIYEVTAQFEMYFDQSMPRPHPQEKHIVKKLAEFDGIWNSYVNINKQEVVNFKTDMPYQFTLQKNPLPSDSRYRSDLIQLLKGDVQTAQQQKEILEQAQRHDAKLREENNK